MGDEDDLFGDNQPDEDEFFGNDLDDANNWEGNIKLKKGIVGVKFVKLTELCLNKVQTQTPMSVLFPTRTLIMSGKMTVKKSLDYMCGLAKERKSDKRMVLFTVTPKKKGKKELNDTLKKKYSMVIDM